MRRWLATVGILGISAILLFTGPMVAHAELGSTGASPAYPREDNARTSNIFIHTIEPGEEVSDGVKVFNYTKEQRAIEVRAVDSILSSDGSFSCRQSAEKKKDVGAWTTLETEKVVIEPESNVLVPFTIVVPKGASPGEHGGCITVQDTKNFASKTGGGVQLGFRTAIRMAITVAGELIKKLKIERIEIARVKNGNYTVSPVAKNEGNVSLDVTARVQIRSKFGQKSDIKKSDYPVIAGATTGWAFEFKRPFWGGYYKAYTSLTYNADPTAGLGEQVKGEKHISRQSAYFFMIPAPKAIAVYAAALLLPIILIVVWLWRRKRSKRGQNKKLRAAKPSWQPYIIQPGDTVSNLAQIYGVPWKKLAKKNKISAPYTLEIGQAIVVPRTDVPPTANPLVTEEIRQQLQPQPIQSEMHARPTHIDQTQQAPASEMPPQPQRRFEPVNTPYSTWALPRESSNVEQLNSTEGNRQQYIPTQFPEYYQTHQAGEYEFPSTTQDDWASPLNDSQGYINNPDAVQGIRTFWDQDSSGKETKVPKPKPKTRSTTKPTIKPKSRKSRAKRPKKEQ